jgi:hypothetical protein
MSNFPLYTSLSTNLSTKDLTIAQKSDFIKRVSKMDPDTCELIYALIKSYHLEHESKDSSFVLPYKGSLAQDRINFNLLNFPKQLRQLLYKFVTIHSKKLKEDKKIKKIQDVPI